MEEQQWKESTGSSWKPEKKDESIEGLLIQVEHNVGVNGSTIYTIERSSDHEAVGVWGSSVLDSRMKAVKVGQVVKITFLGLGEKKPGKNPPKLFRVQYRDPVPTTEDIAF